MMVAGKSAMGMSAGASGLSGRGYSARPTTL